jgi:hypothetical protein
MAPKLPAKFDDISKTASSVLGDDFQCSSYQLKAKQATNFGGATSDVIVDYNPKGPVMTPAKLSFKFPKPLPMLEGLAIDKLDLDKNGGIKLESSLSKALHKVDGLKVEVKSDFKDALSFGSVYTGQKDALLKFETSYAAPTNFTLEALHGRGSAVIGAQLVGTSSPCPSMGASYTHGDIFASVIAKNKFSEFTVHGLYSMDASKIKLACSYQQGGKKSGQWAVGGSAGLGSDMTAKAKFDGTNVSATLKKDLAKGTKLFGGLAYNLQDGNMTTGAKLSIE